MSFATRCPVCATTFRVQRAQLSARGGRVRCGKCGTVFDGVAGLVEESAERFSLEPSPQLGLFDPRAPKPATAGAAPKQAWPEDEPLPEFLAEPASSARFAWLWGFLALLAFLALVAQVAYRYRTELAVLAPAARPYLEAACRELRCEVPLPRRPELMSIESSDLQADTRREGGIVLNALIRNRAPFPQELPSLELTLTDDADRPVLRRVLAPADYLDPARSRERAEGVGPGGELALRVHLEAGRGRATGYRLYLFYPQ